MQGAWGTSSMLFLFVLEAAWGIEGNMGHFKFVFMLVGSSEGFALRVESGGMDLGYVVIVRVGTLCVACGRNCKRQCK